MDPKTDQLNRAIAHIVEERRSQIAIREAADANVRRMNHQIYQAMVDGVCKRTQLSDGTTVSIVEPKPRLTIVGEKLLALGVDPDKIRAATRETLVDPYVRVDPPKAPGAEANAPSTSPAGTGIDPGTDEGTRTH